MVKNYRKRKAPRTTVKMIKSVVRKMSETKCRYSALSINALVSTDGSAVAVCQVPQGTDGQSRIGSSIQLRRLKISGQLITLNSDGSSPPPDTTVRMMLFYSSGEQFTQADLGDYLTGAYDPKRFFPLHDRYYSIPLDYVGSTEGFRPRLRTFTINKVVKYHQKYSGPNGTDQTRGFLVLALNHLNDSNQQSALRARQEIWYDDI